MTRSNEAPPPVRGPLKRSFLVTSTPLAAAVLLGFLGPEPAQAQQDIKEWVACVAYLEGYSGATRDLRLALEPFEGPRIARNYIDENVSIWATRLFDTKPGIKEEFPDHQARAVVCVSFPDKADALAWPQQQFGGSSDELRSYAWYPGKPEGGVPAKPLPPVKPVAPTPPPPPKAAPSKPALPMLVIEKPAGPTPEQLRQAEADAAAVRAADAAEAQRRALAAAQAAQADAKMQALLEAERERRRKCPSCQ